jgi:hypothetical protein
MGGFDARGAQVTVPWRHRFRIDWEHKDWRGSLRIVCGFIVIYVARQWPEYTAFQLESTLQIGWIPLKVEEGACVPCWTVFKRTSEVPWDWYKREG